MGIVEGGADQIIHGRIDDQEALARPLLDIDHAGQQPTSLRHQEPPWFDDEGEAERHDRFDQNLPIGFQVKGCFALINYAEAPAHVYAF